MCKQQSRSLFINVESIWRLYALVGYCTEVTRPSLQLGMD